MKGSEIDTSTLARLLDGSNYTVLILGDRFAEDIGMATPSPYNKALWSRFGKYMTLEGLLKDPVGAWSFYKGLYEKALELEGSSVYKSILELVKKGLVQSIITTSIDGVLSRDKTINVVELSGNIRVSWCIRNKHKYDTGSIIEEKMYQCPVDGDPIRPGIVFYGEEVGEREWIRALVEISSSELVIAAGLDPVIAPYNILPIAARMLGKKLVVVDMIKWGAREIADAVLTTPPTSIWGKLVKLL